MIKFITPYLDARELEVLKSRFLPSGSRRSDLLAEIRSHFPAGSIAFAEKGEFAIRAVVERERKRLGRRLEIAIPAMLCGSVYRATKDFGRVTLMDCDESSNCVPDTISATTDLLLFAGLGGKRMSIPARGKPDQILIDDSAQCFDRTSGFSATTDYSIFSFGEGKQMYAGGGAIIWSAKNDLSDLSAEIPDWQIYLMASQLAKLREINAKRRENALYLIEKLSGIDWLTLPDPTDHSFLKFIVRIDRGGKSILSAERPRDHFRFIEHMHAAGVEPEDWYVPLNVRFPGDFPEPRYRVFLASTLWTEAITLPCRPQLERSDLDLIAGAVRSFRPEKSTIVATEQSKWNDRYTPAMLGRPDPRDFFGKLFDEKLDVVRSLGRGKKILEVGCGSGAHTLQLLAEGFDVTGLDFAPKMLDALKESARERGLSPDRVKTICADACKIPIADASFDCVFSFSTLNHVDDRDKALREIARVLKPGGLAAFEMGQRRSLAHIEAGRVVTGVRSHHSVPGALEKMITSAGLTIETERMFQLFPLYDGATPSEIAVNLALRDELGKRAGDGRLLDEHLSSAEVLRHAAFRRLFVARKPKPGEIRPEAKPAPSRPALVMSDAERKKTATEGFRLIGQKRISEGTKCLVRALLADPGDLMIAAALFELYDSPEKRAFSRRMSAIADRLGRAASAGKNGIDSSPSETSAPTVAKRRPGDPRVSVVMPTYNQSAFLERAIRTALDQTYGDFELIVVDDGSTDDTQAVLARFNDPRMKVIRQENRRLPSALNRGFAEARGELWTWISSDNICAPYFLEGLVTALDFDPEAVLAASAFAWIDDKDRILRVQRDQDLTRRGFFARNAGVAAFLYRADVAARVGAYAPELEGAEDWEYWQRLLDFGPAVYVPEVLYYYRTHGDSMTNTMSTKVLKSGTVVARKERARIGIAIDRLYPALESSTGAYARAHAAADLAARLLQSPFSDPRDAENLLDEALKELPCDPEILADAALASLYAGDFRQALRRADAAITVGSNAPAARALANNVITAAHARQSSLSVEPIFRPRQKVEALEREHRRFVSFTEEMHRTRPVKSANSAAFFPSISFCIITAGKRPDSIERVIASIRRLRVPQTEIIVAGRPPLVRDIVRVELFEAADSGNLGRMRNESLRVARSEFVCILDDDMILDPDWYESLTRYGPDFDVLTSTVHLPDGTRYWGHAGTSGPLGHRMLHWSEDDPGSYMSGGCAWVMRRRVAEHVTWPEDRGFYESEDVDFAHAVRRAGFRIRHAPLMIAWHDDATYTSIGRRVFRRTAYPNAAWVERELATATGDEIHRCARAHCDAGRVAEAADALRYGLRHFPGNAEINSMSRDLLGDAGGHLPGIPFSPHGHPAYRAAVAV